MAKPPTTLNGTFGADISGVLSHVEQRHEDRKEQNPEEIKTEPPEQEQPENWWDWIF